MRASRHLIAVIAITLPALFAFQNCTETLPERESKTLSLVSNAVTATASAGPGAVLPGAPVMATYRLTPIQDLRDVVLKQYIVHPNNSIVTAQSRSVGSLTAGLMFENTATFVMAEDLAPGTYSVAAEVLSADGSSIHFPMTSLAAFQVRAAIRVSVGASAPYTDILGRVWSADTGITGSSVPVNNETYPPIGNTNDQQLYTPFRYGTGPFAFTAGVPSPGRYKVTLKFMEHWVFGPGLRLFNVAINGEQVLANYDLFVAAGGAYIAHDRTFITTAGGPSPQVKIDFTHGPIENPKINAIEILGAP